MLRPITAKIWHGVYGHYKPHRLKTSETYLVVDVESDTVVRKGDTLFFLNVRTNHLLISEIPRAADLHAALRASNKREKTPGLWVKT